MYETQVCCMFLITLKLYPLISIRMLDVSKVYSYRVIKKKHKNFFYIHNTIKLEGEDILIKNWKS